MPLNLNTSPHLGPGRRAAPLEFEIVRPVTEADLAALALPAPQAQGADHIKRLTDRHHSLARLLAAGTPEGEAALIVGYDPARVSILKESPAFRELLALYRSEVDHQFSTVLEHMAGLSRDALLVLRERLEESADKFTNNELRGLVTDLVDRTARESDPMSDKLPTLVELVAPDLAGPDADCSEGGEPATGTGSGATANLLDSPRTESERE